MTVSTPVVEVSKIQLRRGPAEDLPGAPTIGNPTLPTTPLDVGEVAFTTDTGQVFIGPDLQTNGSASTLSRAFFPYQNIEILTENSRDFLSNLFDYYYRDVQTGFYNSLPLNNTTGDEWQTLLVNCGNSQIPCIISATSNLVCVQINYYLYDTGTVVRTGKMSSVYIGGSAQPILDDEYTVYARTDLGSGPASDPTQLYGSVQFRAVPMSGGGSGQNVVLEYQNLGATNPLVFFRLERGAAEGGNTICSSSSESSTSSGSVILTFQIGNTPVLMDTWGTSTITGGVGSYFVIAVTNAGTGTGSQISNLVVGTDGATANYEDDAMYFSPGSSSPNILNYDISCTAGVVSVSANTIATGAVATVTLIKFPVYLVQS